MKLVFTIGGLLLAALGAIWIFQGLNMIRGSFMSGQPQWVVFGGLAVVLGGTIVVWAHRRR